MQQAGSPRRLLPREGNSGDRLQPPPLHALDNPLLLQGVVKFLLRGAQILARFLQVVEFLLLTCVEQRTDLRHGAVHYRLCFLHRILVDGHDLRLGLIEDRLDLCLLIRREVQRFGQVFERKSMPVPAARAGWIGAVRLRQSEAAQRDCAHDSECE
jgi:hypothetical protein